MTKKIELISTIGNFAIAHLKERAFPGVLVQGDTLQSLVVLLKEISVSGELRDENQIELNDQLEIIESVMRQYESDCLRLFGRIPYNRRSQI